MNKPLLGFAIIYGEVSAAVLTITAALVFVGTERGEAMCRKLGLELMGCRASVAAGLLVAFSIATIVSYRAFIQKQKKSDAADEVSSKISR